MHALEQLEAAAGQCQLAGHRSGQLEAVSDLIRQELRERFHGERGMRKGPASFVSRALAGVLLVGGRRRIMHACMMVSSWVTLPACMAVSYLRCRRPRVCFSNQSLLNPTLSRAGSAVMQS